jgi:hypothetical protein
MIFHQAVAVDWEAINHEHQWLVAASNNNKGNKYRLNKQYAP